MIDIRIIATSNRDLLRCVEQGGFRQDLYYRLNVFPVQVPPLCDRVDDVLVLAEHFLRRFARKHGVKVTGLSDSASAAVMAYRWPGNVRELQNTLERAVILSEPGRLITAAALGLPADLSLAELPAPAAAPADDPAIALDPAAIVWLAPSLEVMTRSRARPRKRLTRVRPE